MEVYKWFLGHFIYVIIAFLILLISGENFNTIVFGTLLSVVLSAVIYIYNYVMYLVITRILNKNSPYCFLAAPVILLIFFLPFKTMVSQLDFGGEYLAHIIVIITFGINIFSYIKTRK